MYAALRRLPLSRQQSIFKVKNIQVAGLVVEARSVLLPAGHTAVTGPAPRCALSCPAGNGNTAEQKNIAPCLLFSLPSHHALSTAGAADLQHPCLMTTDFLYWHMVCITIVTQRIGKYFPVGSKEGFYDYC
ncbi:hypothetical protein [Desulfovibrio sp. ZJ200]|uniref:hypothetical protein n=1 Tax=Desulfovibrio sp. ZJ200 TaxID=2709792 RepID=UPI00197DFDF3|nr:hypothetical protein [Desulfovibrio sp. ZJ200]